MPILKKTAAVAALVALSVPAAFADGVIAVNAVTADSKMVSPDYVMPYGQAASYAFDESMINFSKSALYEMKCRNDVVLSALGVVSSRSLTSVGYEQDGLNVTVDLNNCTVNAYPTTWDSAPAKGVSKEDAIAVARAFVAKFGGLTLPLGQPTVTGTDRSGYPIMYAKAASAGTDAVAVPVVTDSQSDVSIDNLYQSVTVLFPFDLGSGVALNTTYGAWPEGFTVTVGGNGKVTGAYGSSKFTLVKRTSEVMDKAGVVASIRKRPLYFGNASGAVSLSVKRSLVQFDYMVGGVSKRFISTGYFLKPTDAQWSNVGGIGVSDYVIGNPN